MQQLADLQSTPTAILPKIQPVSEENNKNVQAVREDNKQIQEILNSVREENNKNIQSLRDDSKQQNRNIYEENKKVIAAMQDRLNKTKVSLKRQKRN